MVSIIMGVYNGALTLPEALNSILSQTYEDWELIACDDCSTDQSGEILLEYAKKDKRIRLISNEDNSGLAASLNHCLQYVKGEYIARMDCDDRSHPERLEKQVAFLNTHLQYQIVGTYMQEFDEQGKHNVVQIKAEPTKYDLPKGTPFFHATIMMRTDAMKKLGGYVISKHTVRTEDVDLWYRFFAQGFIGANISEPLYMVRIDEAALKRRKLKYMLHASYIIWYGCDMVKLPFYYKIFCIKPILSWVLSPKIKMTLRKCLLR